MSGTKIEQTEGYTTALALPGQPEDVQLCATYEQAVNALGSCGCFYCPSTLAPSP